MTDYTTRANYLFEQSRRAIDVGCKTMHADHAASGQLSSGNTATEAVVIFERETRSASGNAAAEVAGTVLSRGREWSRAMNSIRASLDQHIAMAPDLLSPSMKLARADRSEGASRAVEGLINDAAERLRAELSAFEEGWTAPRPKLWTERHPVIYALALLLAGSLIGTAFSYLLPARR